MAAISSIIAGVGLAASVGTAATGLFQQQAGAEQQAAAIQQQGAIAQQQGAAQAAAAEAQAAAAREQARIAGLQAGNQADYAISGSAAERDYAISQSQAQRDYAVSSANLSSEFATREYLVNANIASLSAEGASRSAAINKQIIQQQQEIENQRRLAMELGAKREKIEILRGAQRGRSIALAAASASGAIDSSGLEGGRAQVTSQGRYQEAGVNKNLYIGRNIFAANKEITGQKISYEDLLAEMASRSAAFQTEKSGLQAEYTRRQAQAQSQYASGAYASAEAYYNSRYGATADYSARQAQLSSQYAQQGANIATAQGQIAAAQGLAQGQTAIAQGQFAQGSSQVAFGQSLFSAAPTIFNIGANPATSTLFGGLFNPTPISSGTSVTFA